MPTNKSNESSSPPMVGQQQLQVNQIGGSRLRPRFCDDVLFDALHFLRRTEHAHVRLASRRLQWLSDKACTSYPLRVVPRLEVCGVALPTANGAETAPLRMVANSMRVHQSPSTGDSHLADFPAVEPPEDIARLSLLEINDFIGPELLQFLRVSAKLMDRGCLLVFSNFDNFVRHHSIDFIVRFFALFPSENRTINLHGLSSRAVPLFRYHPTIFKCSDLVVEYSDTFPLDALQNWLHLDERLPLEQQRKRYLGMDILVTNQFHARYSVASVDHFVQQLRQRFLNAISCCPFTMEIALCVWPNFPVPLDPFVEHNERTGELLEFSRDHPNHYSMQRRRRTCTLAGRKDDNRKAEMEEERATSTTQMDKETKVYIYEVAQGDRQLLLDSKDRGEK